MARKKKKTTAKKASRKKAPARKAKGKGRKTTKALDFIISKSRTKAASGINVSGEFYSALDASVRELINQAEQRATDNGRKTLRPYDL